MKAIHVTVVKRDVEEDKLTRRLITTSAGYVAHDSADYHQLERTLESLPPMLSVIDERALMAVMAACDTALDHRRRAATETSATLNGDSGGQGASGVVSGTLEMLLALRASSVGTLFSSVTFCLKELLPLALCVLAGTDPDPPDSAVAGQQQQPSQSCAHAKASGLGGKRPAKMRELPASKGSEASGDDNDSNSKTSILAAATTFRLLRLSILCLGSPAHVSPQVRRPALRLSQPLASLAPCLPARPPAPVRARRPQPPHAPPLSALHRPGGESRRWRPRQWPALPQAAALPSCVP